MPFPFDTRSMSQYLYDSAFARGNQDKDLSSAEAEVAGGNLTILIYKIDKMLSLQLRGYVINCVLITAAATSSECSNLQRKWGRYFKLMCVNSEAHKYSIK